MVPKSFIKENAGFLWYHFGLYNNTCSFCIFIGRELCVIKVHTHEWRQLMAWSNLANLFRGSSHELCQLYYNIKQIDFIFLCFCTVIVHRWRHSVWRTKSHALDCISCVLFCSSHAMTLSVIYYSTDARRTQKWNLFVKYYISWMSIYISRPNLQPHFKLWLKMCTT